MKFDNQHMIQSREIKINKDVITIKNHLYHHYRYL